MKRCVWMPDQAIQTGDQYAVQLQGKLFESGMLFEAPDLCLRLLSCNERADRVWPAVGQ